APGRRSRSRRGRCRRRAPAPLPGASAPRSPVAQLSGVLVAVGALLLEHLFHVSAGFREGDPVDVEIAAAPLIDVAGTGVVGGEGGDDVTVVAVEQFPQQVGAVADVDFRVAQVLELESGAAAVALDFVGGVRGDLHQAAGAGTGGAVAELRL